MCQLYPIRCTHGCIEAKGNEMTKATDAELRVVFHTSGGPFVVTRYDANRLRSVRRGRKLYDTVEEALADAIKFERPGKPMLMVDFASAVPA